jgi:hypothetical protein
MLEIEYNQLPPPTIETSPKHTRICLFTPRAFTEMEKSERIEAVYLHACLRHVTHQRTRIVRATISGGRSLSSKQPHGGGTDSLGSAKPVRYHTDAGRLCS